MRGSEFVLDFFCMSDSSGKPGVLSIVKAIERFEDLKRIARFA